jgi:hypothetical protein
MLQKSAKFEIYVLILLGLQYDSLLILEVRILKRLQAVFR